MDPTDGFILLVFTVIMFISFVFGFMCSTFIQQKRDIQHKRDDHDYNKNTNTPPTETLFQIKGKDHCQVHYYSESQS